MPAAQVDLKKLAKTIGAAARTARTARGWTQQDVAERLDLSTEFYARLERGATLPSIPTLVRISAVLDLSPDTLLGQPRTSGVAERSREYRAEREGRSDVRSFSRKLRHAKPGTIRLLSRVLNAVEGRRR